MLKFIGHGLVKGQIELFDGRHAVPPQACLGKGGYLMGKLYGGLPGFTFWDNPIDQPHLQRFVCFNRSAGQNEIERTAQTDQSRKTNRTAIN